MKDNVAADSGQAASHTGFSMQELQRFTGETLLDLLHKSKIDKPAAWLRFQLLFPQGALSNIYVCCMLIHFSRFIKESQTASATGRPHIEELGEESARMP